MSGRAILGEGRLQFWILMYVWNMYSVLYVVWYQIVPCGCLLCQLGLIGIGVGVSACAMGMAVMITR